MNALLRVLHRLSGTSPGVNKALLKFDPEGFMRRTVSGAGADDASRSLRQTRKEASRLGDEGQALARDIDGYLTEDDKILSLL